MPEIKHTPGPWRVVKGFMGQIEIESDNERDNADDSQVYVLAREIGGKIHGERFDDYSEQEANVSLIVAAPDLLAALIESRGVISTALKTGAPDWFDSDEAVSRHSTVQKIDAAIAKATQPRIGSMVMI